MVQKTNVAYSEDRFFHIAAIGADPDPVVILEFCKDLVGVAMGRVQGCYAIGRGFRDEVQGKIFDFRPEVRSLSGNSCNFGIRAASFFDFLQPSVDLPQDADGRRKGRLAALHVFQSVSKVEVHGTDGGSFHDLDCSRGKDDERNARRSCKNLLRASDHDVGAAILHVEGIREERRDAIADIEQVVLFAEVPQHLGVIENAG